MWPCHWLGQSEPIPDCSWPEGAVSFFDHKVFKKHAWISRLSLLWWSLSEVRQRCRSSGEGERAYGSQREGRKKKREEGRSRKRVALHTSKSLILFPSDSRTEEEEERRENKGERDGQKKWWFHVEKVSTNNEWERPATFIIYLPLEFKSMAGYQALCPWEGFHWSELGDFSLLSVLFCFYSLCVCLFARWDGLFSSLRYLQVSLPTDGV